MSYTLYTAEKCHQCTEVVKYLKELNIECRVVNIDREEERPPVIIFAFPALFRAEELIAYGTDVRNYFAKKD